MCEEFHCSCLYCDDQLKSNSYWCFVIQPVISIPSLIKKTFNLKSLQECSLKAKQRQRAPQKLDSQWNHGILPQNPAILIPIHRYFCGVCLHSDDVTMKIFANTDVDPGLFNIVSSQCRYMRC